MITITRQDIREALYAESTNAIRTLARRDGTVPDDNFVIDNQAEPTLDGAWREATSKLAEKMSVFLTGTSLANDMAQYVFSNNEPAGLESNVQQYVVNYMMADWLASIRPDYRQHYVERANFELDDIQRKLYKREAPL